MMCAGSLVIAFLPTYASIGAWAPALLLMARLFQGLSVGGEYGTTATYMSEVALKGQAQLKAAGALDAQDNVKILTSCPSCLQGRESADREMIRPFAAPLKDKAGAQAPIEA